MKNDIEVKTIQKYAVMMFSSCNAENAKKAVIMMTGDNVFLGYVNFLADGAILPEAHKSYNLFYFYYHFSDLSAMVDLMRNEKPVYLFYMEKNKSECRISTTLEPIGEGEI